MSAMGVYRHSFIRQTCAKDCGIGWWLFLPLLLFPLLYSSCSTIDERDECCEEVVIHFRYSRGTKDEFGTYIQRMNYYVFDESEQLLHSFIKDKTDGNLQRLSLRSVEPGRYKVLAIGNAHQWSLVVPEEISEITLSRLILEMTHQLREGVHGDSDPLYFGVQAYEVKPFPMPQHFLCDMSNAHCHLTATFRWADTPPSDGVTPFTIELIDVARSYQLGKSYAIGVSRSGSLVTSEDCVVHSFPYLLVDVEHRLVIHQKDAPYLAGRVRGELTTLRYSDQYIPMIRLLQGDKEVMRPLPLAKIFRDFKWGVSDNIEQRYELEFLLYDNGRIEVRVGDQLQILDWINGGTIG